MNVWTFPWAKIYLIFLRNLPDTRTDCFDIPRKIVLTEDKARFWTPVPLLKGSTFPVTKWNKGLSERLKCRSNRFFIGPFLDCKFQTLLMSKGTRTWNFQRLSDLRRVSMWLSLSSLRWLSLKLAFSGLLI